MRILFLSYYYEPDLSAGSFRAKALVKELLKLGAELEVVTTLPNRYSSYTSSALEHEMSDGLEVHRINLPSHQSGMLDQIKAFFCFYRSAKKLTKNRDYDLVFATSSRLFTAFLGARIAKRKELPLYLDVRDIFVDTMKDVLSPTLTWFIKPILSLIERYTFARANKINLVSEGFRDYFQSRFLKPKYQFYTNGIDGEFLQSPEFSSEKALTDLTPTNSDILKVVYAGNIGEGQGLHLILPDLASQLGPNAEFTVIGDGGRKEQLSIASSGVTNIKLLPPVKRNELIDIYKQADVLFLHLNDYPAFEKVLPSKIFEYGATGKPILAGVAGYAKAFLNEEVENAAVFEPGDAKKAANALKTLDLRVVDRAEFKKKFARETIMMKMARDVYSEANNS